MSALLMGRVWGIELSSPEQAIMLALADHGKDDGTDIYPSVKMLAWKTGKKERQVQNILRRLEHQQLIIPVAFATGGRGHATRYEMHLENGTPKSALERDDPVKGAIDGNDPVKGAIDGTERVQDNAPITVKGAIDGTERVQSSVIKGAIAIAPEPSYNHQSNHIAAAAISAHAHARTREGEDGAAAAERDENVITQTADAVRRHLRMGRDKLPGLRLIVAQYPGARPWLENQANLCYETLKVRPLQLKHFSNWLDEYERRRNAPREGIAHEQPQQQPASPTAEHRPRAEAEGSLSGPERGAAIWAAVIASLEEDQPGSAGALLAMSGNHQRGQVSDVSRRGTGLPEMPGDALPANRDGELGDAD